MVASNLCNNNPFHISAAQSLNHLKTLLKTYFFLACVVHILIPQSYCFGCCYLSILGPEVTTYGQEG